MGKEKIRVLISLIGKFPDHVDHFVSEKGQYLKKVYLLHTRDSSAPPNRRGIIDDDAVNSKTLDYGKLADQYISKLKKQKPRLKIIPVEYQKAHDIHELQHVIQKIVNGERDEFLLREEIAIDISGGTNIAAAAQMMAVFRIGIDAYYDDSTKEIGERIQKINTTVEDENDLKAKAFKVLKTIRDSEFIVQPRPEDSDRFFDDKLRKVIPGMITNSDLVKELGTRSVSPLQTLLKKNLIEKLNSYPVYRDVSLHKTDEPDWKMEQYDLPAYRITEDGLLTANTRPRA